MAATLNTAQSSPVDALHARNRRTLRLALVHALLAVAILAGFVFAQMARS